MTSFERTVELKPQRDATVDPFTPEANVYTLGSLPVFRALVFQEFVQNGIVGYQAYGNHTGDLNQPMTVAFFPNHAIAAIEYPQQAADIAASTDEPYIPERHEGSE